MGSVMCGDDDLRTRIAGIIAIHTWCEPRHDSQPEWCGCGLRMPDVDTYSAHVADVLVIELKDLMMERLGFH